MELNLNRIRKPIIVLTMIELGLLRLINAGKKTQNKNEKNSPVENIRMK